MVALGIKAVQAHFGAQPQVALFTLGDGLYKNGALISLGARIGLVGNKSIIGLVKAIKPAVVKTYPQTLFVVFKNAGHITGR